MKTISIDGVEFVIDLRDGKERDQSRENRFVLVKSNKMLDHYEKMKSRRPRTILEVGVFQGGSLVYLDKMLSPEKIVGVDIKREPIPALDAYIETHPHMKMYYARSQDKPGTLMAARENFPRGVELVIDDASHLYEQSKKTFEMLFPLVTTGGEYIIEDWGWSHKKRYQASDAVWHDKTALTTLILELVIMAEITPSIESVHVNSDFVSVRRGLGPLPKDAFNLAPYLRGKSVPVL